MEKSLSLVEEFLILSTKSFTRLNICITKLDFVTKKKKRICRDRQPSREHFDQMNNKIPYRFADRDDNRPDELDLGPDIRTHIIQDNDQNNEECQPDKKATEMFDTFEHMSAPCDHAVVISDENIG